MHGIRYDAIHDEFIVPQEIAQAILTFRGGASGEEPPLRVIQGPLTQLVQPDRVEVDPVHNEIVVPEGDKILVFPREANGNVTPTRVLRGPDTQLGGEEANVDPIHNLLVVGGRIRKGGNRLPAILIFGRTDQENTRPRAVIAGPKTGLVSGGRMTLYPSKGWMFITVRGPGGEDSSRASDNSFVGVWNVQDDGDVPPRWTIGGPKGLLRQPRGVTLDPKNKNVIVSDKFLNAVLTYHFPEIF
jgi:hypothetical protein